MPCPYKKNLAEKLFPRQNNHAAGFALTGAFRGDIWVVSQSQVNEASFGGRHRLASEWRTLSLDLLGHLAGEVLKSCVTASFVTFDIDNYRHPLVGLVANDKSDQILQTGKGQSSSANQDTQVIAFDIEGKRPAGFAVFFIIDDGSGGCLYRGIDFHQIEELFQDFPDHLRSLIPVAVRFEHGDLDHSIFSPDAEYAGLTFLYDLHFHLVPTDA